MPEEKYMRLAIDKAIEGIRAGQTPFGACVVSRDGNVVSVVHNRVWKATDITAHAEVTAIREACATLAIVDLAGHAIYSTCEPCPMCFAACHWANLDLIVAGAKIEDAKKAGFNELTISNALMKDQGGSRIEIIEGFMREECAALFDLWLREGDHRTY